MGIDLFKDIDHKAVCEVLNVKENYGYTLKRTHPEKYECVARGLLVQEVDIDNLVLILQLLENVTDNIETNIKNHHLKNRAYNKGRNK